MTIKTIEIDAVDLKVRTDYKTELNERVQSFIDKNTLLRELFVKTTNTCIGFKLLIDDILGDAKEKLHQFIEELLFFGL